MKKILLACLATVVSLSSVLAGEMVLRGTFQGENLYVKNPFAASGVGFCVYEVTVNGQTTTDEINSSAFEVNLMVYDFNIGQSVAVGIKYKEDCAPKVLNPEVLNARTTFEITDIKVTDGKIAWSTKNEAGVLPYVIEQYRWNKWVKVGEVNGKGTASENSYEADVRQHTGENKFRLKQVDYRKKPRYSDEVIFVSSKAEVTFGPRKVEDVLTFSAPTLYEIYDEYGGIVFKGYSDEVKVASLEKGKYYINFDNKMEEFTKK
nr:hypothetical protein [uncultured Carboxylicivirga sp.]